LYENNHSLSTYTFSFQSLLAAEGVVVVEGQLLAAVAVCWPQLLRVEEAIEKNNISQQQQQQQQKYTHPLHVTFLQQRMPCTKHFYCITSDKTRKLKVLTPSTTTVN